jgi:hypothetical protein
MGQDLSIYNRLKKLFSTDVVVRNIGGKKLKVVDTEKVQFATDRNSLRDRFNRLRSSTYNVHNRDLSMSYQAARLELFRDYDVMDMDPILASALDIISDECTTDNEMGQTLTIKTDDDNIKSILDNLFYDILNIDFNLWSWVRNILKYGDFFLRLDISPEYGVYSVDPLSPYEVTRIEGIDPTNKNYVKFQHDGQYGGMESNNSRSTWKRTGLYSGDSDGNFYTSDWIFDYALAECKIILGRIRSKFAQFNSIGNIGIALDGDTLIQEGIQEKERLEETLRLEESHEGYGIIWG